MHTGSMASGGEGRSLVPGQGPVLRIIVENLFYPVTLEVLQQVCVQIITFPSVVFTDKLKLHVVSLLFDRFLVNMAPS